MASDHDIALMVRTIRLAYRFLASDYDRREITRNMTEIFLDESRFTLGCLRDYVANQISSAADPNSHHYLDGGDKEIMENLQTVMDKVCLPGERPRAMTQDELDEELRALTQRPKPLCRPDGGRDGSGMLM